MLTTDSVFVVASARGNYAAHDLLRAIRWSCLRPAYVVLVDAVGDITAPTEPLDNFMLLRAEAAANTQAGFLAGLGIRWCLDKGIKAKQYVLVDDKCLVLHRGIDDWALQRLEKQQVGLLGVVDRLNYEDAYGKCRQWFDRWEAPHTQLEPGPYTLHEAAIWLTGPLAELLYQRNLLTPDGCETWPLPYGPYLSWLGQMLGFYQVGWGSMDKHMPPLYVNHTGRSRHQPAPHILSPQFLLYYSVRHCTGYTEVELREAYKRFRGESSQPIQPLTPTVSPRQTGPTVLG